MMSGWYQQAGSAESGKYIDVSGKYVDVSGKWSRYFTLTRAAVSVKKLSYIFLTSYLFKINLNIIHL